MLGGVAVRRGRNGPILLPAGVQVGVAQLWELGRSLSVKICRSGHML